MIRFPRPLIACVIGACSIAPFAAAQDAAQIEQSVSDSNDLDQLLNEHESFNLELRDYGLVAELEAIDDSPAWEANIAMGQMFRDPDAINGWIRNPDDPAYILMNLISPDGPDGEDSLIKITDERALGARLTAGQSPNVEFSIPEAVLDFNNMLPIQFFEQGLAAQRAVGRITVREPLTDSLGRYLAPTKGIGTGFLVGPRTLMTNAHVIPDTGVARALSVWFNFQCVGPTCTDLVEVYRIDHETLWVDTELDIALVELVPEDRPGAAPENPGDRYGFLELKPYASYTYAENLPVNIIQHPRGEPKTVTIQDNKILTFHAAAQSSRFRYSTDTSKGSSGSPLFDNTWRLVGVHRAAGPDGGSYNEGIRIDSIVKRLVERGVTIEGVTLEE